MTAPVPVRDLPEEKRATGMKPERMSEAKFRANVLVGGGLFVLGVGMLVAGVAVTL